MQGEQTGSEEQGGMMEQGKGVATAMSQDGSVTITVTGGKPAKGTELPLSVDFTDANGKDIANVNYDISVMQDGKSVLDKSSQHTDSGIADLKTSALGSDSAVNVQITLLGIGKSGDQANWTGPMGETVSLSVVPEFGPIAMIVLAVAIVSIVAVTARSKVIPRL